MIIETEPTGLNNDLLTLYYTKDSSVGNLPIVVFHGSSTTTNSTLNTSRIQAHIFSVAGFQSSPRLTISPTSSLYSAVHQLPDEDQGDEICRGLAISLLKYFNEIPPSVKECIQNTIARGSSANSLFNAAHAARLACEMERVENPAQITTHLMAALSSKSVSWIDIDLILPSSCVETGKPFHSEDTADGFDDVSIDYGKYSELVEMFGSPSFIPTSRIRRAPSRPTGGKKSLALSDEQVEALKLDLQEILDTERSYVSKIRDLTNVINSQSITDAAPGLPPNVEAIARSFSLCVSSILEANTSLLHQLEDFSGGDIDTEALQDVTGTLSFSKLFLESIPALRQPYIEYIRTSNAFINILGELLRNTTPAHMQQIQEIGEQRLRSWLIEPIQRLPRYVLLLENMVKKLPIIHPAVSKLLKAKDLISEILDAEEVDTDYNSKVLKRLRNLVSGWPTDISPNRLVTAVDVVELEPPYVCNSVGENRTQGLILLFPSHVMVLRKHPGSTLSARGLMAEIDRPSVNTIGATQSLMLSHAYTFDLSETDFTEADNGSVVYLRSSRKVSMASSVSDGYNNSVIIQAYALQGAYDGKAAKWSEDVARARIEHRWPERTRETTNWSLRALSPDKQHLGIVSAIFAGSTESHSDLDNESQAGTLVIVQDGTAVRDREESTTKKQIVCKIILTSPSKYRLEFWRHGHHISTDNIHAVDFINTFLRRLGNAQRLQYQPTELETACIHVASNQKIADTIRPNLSFRLEMQSTKSRPMSPVKLLSSFLGGIRDQAVSTKTPKLERSPSKQSLHSMKGMKPGLGLNLMNTLEPVKSQPVAKLTSEGIDTAFAQLEKTLDTYVVALHSRCGNVVGKVIRNRGQADHLMVNELYNILLEDPTQYQATAEVSVDVLFAAFENFLNHAWKDKIGPLLPSPILVKLEHIFHTQSSVELGASFKNLAQEMAPQNQRAFSALIKLVYDLLDASGNDGDRGAITAAFVEAIFPMNDNQKYISLLDQMVDNIDVLFDDIAIPESKPATQFNSVGRRTKATTPGSINSVTSSFRKRFGFGKTQQDNNQAEPESRVSQMIRNLSKKATNETSSQPSSLSRSFLTRSKSIDDENRRPFFSRPGSSSGKEAQNKLSPVSNTSPTIVTDMVPPLATAASYRTGPARKKRRSSLSDITSMQHVASPDFSTFVKPRPLDTPTKTIVSPPSVRALPRTPAPTKLPSIHNTPMSPIEPTSKIPSPALIRKTSPLSSLKKENVPPPTTADRVSPKPRHVPASSELGVPKKRDMASSQIPSLKPGAASPALVVAKRTVLSPPTPGIARRKASSTPQRITSNSLHRVSVISPQRRTPSAQRLRMQSPQKLRERLEKEKKAIDQVSLSLHSGLKQIHEDVDADALPTEALQKRVRTLETKFTNTLRDLTKQNADIQADLETSLVVSEKKAKGLDDAYRDANAENELIYEKFNGELLKVLEAVKSGAGLQEMKTKLKEAQDEAARLRKENQRLRRENLGLKSQFR